MFCAAFFFFCLIVWEKMPSKYIVRFHKFVPNHNLVILIPGPNIRSWKVAQTRALERKKLRQKLNQVITHTKKTHMHLWHAMWFKIYQNTSIMPRTNTLLCWLYVLCSQYPMDLQIQIQNQPIRCLGRRAASCCASQCVLFALILRFIYQNIVLTLCLWWCFFFLCIWEGTWRRWDIPTPSWTCAPNAFVPFWVATARRQTGLLPASRPQNQNLTVEESHY